MNRLHHLYKTKLPSVWTDTAISVNRHESTLPYTIGIWIDTGDQYMNRLVINLWLLMNRNCNLHKADLNFQPLLLKCFPSLVCIQKQHISCLSIFAFWKWMNRHGNQDMNRLINLRLDSIINMNRNDSLHKQFWKSRSKISASSLFIH